MVDGGQDAVGRGRAALPRWELWIPAAYATASAVWIAISDLVLAARPGSPGEHAILSIAKGLGFVAVTAALLHAGLRWVLARERATLRRVEASEALLHSVMDAIPDAVFVKDRRSAWLYANPATLAVAGKALADVLGRTDREIWGDPAVGEALVATDGRVMESRRAETVEETVQTPAGYRVFLSAKAPVIDRDGRVIGIVGTARDVTDAKRAEEAMRRNEERERYLATILQTALDGFYAVGADGRLLEVNDAYCAMSGFSREELLGMRLPDIEAAETPEETRAHAAKIAALGADRFRTRHRRKDGRIIDVESSVKYLPENGGTYVCFIRDITRETAAREALERSQKLESVGRLAGGIAHDFNNLLTVVLACAEAIREDLAAGSAQLDDVEEIRTAAEHGRDLTRRLLAFARKEVVTPVALDLNELLRGSEKILRRVLGEDVELAVRLAPDLPPVHCDPGQLEQVVLNLAVNARDAMPSGGTLAIETSAVRIDAAGPAGGGRADVAAGDYVQLAVQDSGSGMAPEIRLRIFEPFFTTKEVGKGTGLGLATVYGIVKQSGGYIRVESEPGRGSRFEILLPRSAEPAAPPPRATAPAGAGGAEAVLLVDDDPGIRKVARRILSQAGYRVLVASGAAEALDIAGRQGDALDMLVTDIVMPGVDGRALADELRRRFPRLRVLFVSGYTRDAIAHRGVLDSGTNFLQKPFTAATLLARVRGVLEAE